MPLTTNALLRQEAAPGTPKPPTPRAAPPPPPPDLLGDLLDLGVDDDIPGVAAGSVPASNGGVLDLLGAHRGSCCWLGPPSCTVAVLLECGLGVSAKFCLCCEHICVCKHMCAFILVVITCIW